MGSRGPVPDPKSARSRDGRNTRTAKRPSTTPALPVSPPQSVAQRPAAAGFWDRHAPDLVAAGRLGPPQVDTFGMLCHLYADSEQLAEQLDAEGWITATEKGQAASPVANLLRAARRDYVTLAREFGLTAASSARLPQEPDNGPQEDDPEAAILRKLSLRAS